MPRYEFKDGKSHKFWEIAQSGNTFTVTYGRVGTAGQSNTKVFADEATATKEAEKVTRSKVKKGYALVAAAAPAADPAQALRDAILANPDDAAAWLVYADWLVEQGDARGQLVHAFAQGGDSAALLEQHQKAFLGRFATDLEPVTTIEWHMGFWRSARAALSYDDELPDDVNGLPSVIGHLLRHPSAEFLQELRLGLPNPEYEPDWQESIDAIVKNGIRPSVRTLFVGDFERPDEMEISWTSIGSLANVWAVLPELRHLTIQGGSIDLGTVRAPALRTMEVWTGGLPGSTLQQIGAGEFPELEDLEIWLGTEEYGGSCAPDHAAQLLQGAGVPKIRRLGLMNYDQINKLVPLIVEAPVLAQLTQLDLSMGTMTDEGGQVLLQHAEKFSHLKGLDLSENFLSDALAEQLQQALSGIVNVAGQEDADDWLYVSVGE